MLKLYATRSKLPVETFNSTEALYGAYDLEKNSFIQSKKHFGPLSRMLMYEQIDTFWIWNNYLFAF